MLSERRDKVLTALEESGWTIHTARNGNQWATHPEQRTLRLGIGAGGSIRWRGRNLPAGSRPRAGDAPGIAEALNAARLHDESAPRQAAWRTEEDTSPKR